MLFTYTLFRASAPRRQPTDLRRPLLFLCSRERLSLVGPLEAGRLVSSLSGFVETLAMMGDAEHLAHQQYEEGKRVVSSGSSGSSGGGVGNDIDQEEEGEQGQGQGLRGLGFSEEWGGGGGVAGRVCQVSSAERERGSKDNLCRRMFVGRGFTAKPLALD